MPDKISPYASYGEKLIKLFAKMLFSGRAYSLIELSQMLGCSKQTVLRLLDDIRRSYGVELEEYMEDRRKYYRIKTAGRRIPALSLNEAEIDVLMMCRSFAEHLLGPGHFAEASQALEKSRSLAGGGKQDRHFTAYRPGTIDYSNHESILKTLLACMENNRCCRLQYRPVDALRARDYTIMPLKIFSHNDTVYLSARLRASGADRLFALQRIRSVSPLAEKFSFPADYDFEKTFNRNFGIIKGEAFRVEAEFSGFAARYVSERIWSPDQKLVNIDRQTVRLSFSASSEPELISWILSFGSEARLLAPEKIRRRLAAETEAMQANYSGLT